MVRLVLFDIDGTLIRTGGAGVKAFETTFAEVFGLREATKTLKFAGRTDVSLVRECFSQHGVEPSTENFKRFFDSYPKFLEQLIKTLPGGVCEGIHDSLEAISRARHKPVLGLLTGNVRRGAELKLSHYGLWHRFETGAFGDDHEDRNCIADTAKKRGEALAGQTLSGEEILVIGDTPLDIACGKSIGAKVLAVGTGNYTRQELQQCGPEWAVDNISQIPVNELLS